MAEGSGRWREKERAKEIALWYQTWERKKVSGRRK